MQRRVQKLATKAAKKLRRALKKDAPQLQAQYGDEDRDPAALRRHDSFSECRKCLEPGIARDCCGNFYCNECFCTALRVNNSSSAAASRIAFTLQIVSRHALAVRPQSIVGTSKRSPHRPLQG